MTPAIVESGPAVASSSPNDATGALGATSSGRAASNRLLLALLIVATALPYLPALGNGFVYDDIPEVTRDVSAQATQPSAEFFFTSVWDFRHAAVTMNSRYYRPLFRTWQRINATLFGFGAVGWHLSSLGAHLAVTILLFFLLRRHFHEPWAAFAGAVVFGVHPVHLESVAWITGIPDPLATFFLLASFLLWLKKLETGNFGFEAGALVCFLAALLTKENTIVLPAIVFLYVLLGHCGNIRILEEKTKRLRAAILEALPFVGVSIVYLAVRSAAIPSLRNASLPWVTHSEALLTLPSVLFFYVRHLVWPAGLTVFPDVRLISSIKDRGLWIPLIVLGSAAAVLAALWRGRRTDGIRLASLAWFALPLLPVLDLALFFRDDFVHDRYLYLPSVGLAMCCAAAARCLLAEKSAVRLRIGLAAAGVLVSGLAVSTAAQSLAWRDNITLYSRAAQLSSNPVPRIFLAVEFMNRGRLPEAREILEQTIQRAPESWSANYYLGYVDYQLSDLSSAETHLRRAVALDAAEPDEYMYLGLTLLAENRLAEAEAQVRSALARNPGGEGYHYALGLALMKEGRNDAGRNELREELRIPSGNLQLHMQIEQMLGDTPAGSGPPAPPPVR